LVTLFFCTYRVCSYGNVNPLIDPSWTDGSYLLIQFRPGMFHELSKKK
jgi:hypothetical protein